MPIISNEALKESVSKACVRYYSGLPIVEREVFVQRITLKFEEMMPKKELVDKNISSMI